MDAPITVTPEGYDFQGQSDAVLRQRKIADLLRQRAMQTQMPEGDMVGKRFVAPSFFQQLNSALQPANAAWAEHQAGQAQDALSSRINQARQQWQSSLPQATAAQPAQPVGFPNEGGAPEIPATPSQLPDRAAVLKATLAGMQIPGNEKAAGLWNQGMAQDLQREDVQQAHREDQATQLAAQRQNKLDQLAFQKQQLEERMQDRNATREQQVQYQKMHDDTLRAMNAETAAARRDAANALASARADARQQAETDKKEVRNSTLVEHLSRRAEPVAPMVNTAQQVQDMVDSYKDPKTGAYKPIPGMGFAIGAIPSSMVSPEGSANRQKVQMFVNSMIRNQAGLSQTLSETENAKLELLASGKYTQKQFTDAWPALMEKINSTVKAVHAGYDPEIVKTYNSRGGGLVPVGPKPKQTSGFTIEVAQ